MRGSEPVGRKRQGRYELGELLGRGGMAEVFAGHTMGDHGFSKPVAIKRLLPELANDEVFVERLIEEAKLLVGLAHGNIVSVMDLAREGDDVFLVMEFVDGPSLRQLIKGRGARGLSLGVASYVVTAAATGLQFAHQRAVIHADVSPSNILLTTSGEVRVADFGIARREGGPIGGEAEVIEGKWAYMAPEQARGEGLSPASDVFALGVTLYELLTGIHPFGRQVTEDERSSEPLRVIPPRVVKPSVPIGLDALCMRMLALDRRDRFATMQQVIDALTDERFANGYREGAADLAAAIHELRPSAMPPLPPSPHTAGVTLVTRSLLAARPTSASEPSEPSSFAKGTVAARGAPAASLNVIVSPARKRWPLVILGAAAVVGTIAAVVLSVAPSDFDRIDPTPPPVVAPVAVAVPMTLPLPTAPTPRPPVTALAPIVVPVPVAPPVVDPARPKPTPIAVAKKKETGTLRLSTSTWAYASIDGGARQEVSMVGAFTLPAGKHTVRISNDELGLKPISTTIVVEASKVRVVRADLESGHVN
ncbi:MAG: serine/threonine-protein kinase [Proteobacteria bacterium]|nr:serine/threonine-protein kinase [Pseudomonadota bacterium]